MQSVQIDFEHEHAVKQFEECVEISRAAAKERSRVALVSKEGFELVDIPDVMFVRQTLQRLAGFRIALIRQNPVAVDGMISPALKFAAHRCLAGSRHAFDQIVSDAHSGSARSFVALYAMPS